jgi:hypothetical protein
VAVAVARQGLAKGHQLEASRSDWLKAKDLEERQEIAAQIQQRAFAVVPNIPTRQCEFKTALHKNLKGDIEAPAFFMWNIEKT